MKHIIIGVLIMVASLYLSGSFMNVSLDPHNWSDMSRYIISFLYSSCVFIGLIMYGSSRG